MIPNLDFDQLMSLFKSVFGEQVPEKALTILIDLPDKKVPDSEGWKDRRSIAIEWFNALYKNRRSIPYTDVVLVTYPNVGSNNNELPMTVTAVAGPFADNNQLQEGNEVVLVNILAHSSIVLAPTELSATAPLKMLARKYGFRGATLPGFQREMIPTLALDYNKIHARVVQLKERMDRAIGAEIAFSANNEAFDLFLDLRFRSGHASGGLMREGGVVGNLPSGEAYIVPYEGEQKDQPSNTRGKIPVQFDNEIVVYNIVQNKAIAVLTGGRFADQEKRKIEEEPAYGNIAELGLGVLGEWGVKALGSLLLDEKLGLHIAFGRSEHFGGVTSPASFNQSQNVIHIDRVYVPSTQPLIDVKSVTFIYADDEREQIMSEGRYMV